MAATSDLHIKVKPDVEWPRYEYIEARSMEQANRLAEQGWRVHTALLVSGSAAKLYLLERERP